MPSATHKNPHISVAAIRRHEQLKALCAAMDVHYHARKQNDHAKAGNLNEGLKVSNGELVVVFDADHAPVRDFLRETVGFFKEDDKLFLVQTPHYFSIPIRWKRTSRPSPACRRKTRCSIRSCSAGSTSGMRRSSAVRPPCCAARR
jgi:cellulose synthase/poly-beta-1,6-N-acetylglucosamine synthase-like glycosyltransferase